MIRFQTLGAIDLRNDETSVATVLSQPKRLALLAYLACSRPRGFRSRDTLLALFWPEADTERARNSLRQALHHLRKGVGEAAITTRGERDVGVDETLLACDAAQFAARFEAGRYEEALALYRGDFLPGLHVQDAPEAERWIDDERTHLRRCAMEGARRLVEQAARRGDVDGAIEWGRRAVAIDPTDESAVRRLLQSLADAGDVTGAMDAYADLVRRLDAEFSLKPSLETTRLVQALSERPATTTAEIAALTPAARARPGAGEGPTGPSESTAQFEGMPETPRPAAPATPAPTDASRSAGSGERSGPWGNAVTILTILGLLAALAIPVIAHLRRGAAPAPVTPSVAVLPFVNMSGDPTNEYLSDGLTEELLHRLAQVPGLQVAARTSAFAFKGRNAPIDSIGRVLRVRHVLEGSVRQSGQRWRITAQLIDAATGYHLWSGTFESTLADVVAVQDSIGTAIVDRLVSTVAASATRASRPTTVPEAHVATMRGWRAFRLNNPDAYAAAIAHFREAIARDATYGYAHAGLATVRLWQAYLRWADPDSGYAEAREMARRALALDSALVDGYLVLGRLAEVQAHDDARAEALYRRAMTVAPSDPRPLSRLAAILARRGLGDDAVAMAERAVRLDPASPAVYSDLANVQAGLQRFAEAEASVRRALTLDPGHPILLGNLAVQLVQQKKFAAAESAIVAVRARAPNDPTQLAQHAYITARLGRAAEARRLADSASRVGASRVSLALTYLALGDTAATYAQLERGARDGDDGMAFVLDTSSFRMLRGTPRFQRLLEAVRARAATR